MPPIQYNLLSLPLRIFEDDPIQSLAATVGPENGEVRRFSIPTFKVGTLDALVQQADDLTKLSSGCEAAVAKVADVLKALLEGNEEKAAEQKLVNDKPTDHYLRNFQWNKVRYNPDRPLGELVENLKKDMQNVDNDVKAKFTQYNSVKGNLIGLQRKQTGNLSTKSLTPIVDPKLLIQDSEYIETHLIVVPTSSRKEFIKSYEKLSEMVVPRSATQVAQDDEFTLFTVTTFKKTSADFLNKCRELKWTPRQYQHVEGGKEVEQRELDRVAKEEKKVWGEALRLGRSGWSESVMIFAHVMTLRVFVETVLRYGLPLDFVSALVTCGPKQTDKVKKALNASYAYLGGSALGRDKNGRVTKDDSSLSSDMAAVGLAVGEGNEYSAYVYFVFDLP